MLVEEFKRCINSDVKSFLDEKEVETLEKAARLADDDTLTHKISSVSKANPRKPFYPPSGYNPSPSLQSGNSSQNAPKPKPPGEEKGHNPLSQPICNYCKQSGHIVSDCPALKRKREKQDGLKPTGLTFLRLTPQSYFKDQNPETDSVMEIYEPFLSDGFVSLNSDSAQSTPIAILRDTAMRKYSRVTGKKNPDPLGPEAKLSDFYAPSSGQRDREFAFAVLGMAATCLVAYKLAK